MANTVRCPECKQVLEHARGYLPTHMRDTQRGALVTGTQVCEMSNRKLVTTCRAIRYHAECPDCGFENEVTITEEYPGAFTGPVKPFLDVECIGCTIREDGYYCMHEECGAKVEQREESWRVRTSSGAGADQSFGVESAALAYVASHPEPDSCTVERVPAGWYDSSGSGVCYSDLPEGLVGEVLERIPAEERSAVLERFMQGRGIHGNPHAAVFKLAKVVHLRLHDDYVIGEEPGPGEELTPGTIADAPMQVCDCCGLARLALPFHHDAHDDSGDSWDCCQECEGAGCDLIECNIRTNPTGGQNG